MTSPLASLRHSTVPLDGQTLAVYDSEDGDETVFLLHGFPNSSEDWRHQVPVLIEHGYRVIAMDLLGLGGSDKPLDVGLYTVAKDTERALLVLDTLGIKRVHIVCHDRGTGPGWGITVTQPERVLSLTSLTVGHINAWADAADTMEWRERCWYMLFFQLPSAPAAMAADDFRMFKQWMRFHPEAGNWAAKLEDERGFEAGIAWYRANANPEGPGFDPLPNVRTPTLILYSPDDQYSTTEAVLRSTEYLDGPQHIVRIDGTTHFMMHDRPDEVNRHILNHLSTYSARP